MAVFKDRIGLIAAHFKRQIVPIGVVNQFKIL